MVVSTSSMYPHKVKVYQEFLSSSLLRGQLFLSFEKSVSYIIDHQHELSTHQVVLPSPKAVDGHCYLLLVHGNLFSSASNSRLSNATKWPFYTSKPPKALLEASICTLKGSCRLIVLTPVMRWLYPWPFGKLSNISVPNLIFFLSSTNQLEEWLSWSIIWWTIHSNLIT